MSTAEPRPTAGLAAAREARGLSPAQAGEQLRLTADVIRAMEEGRYDDLGPPVFARGHLRKYAGLLGVSVEDLLADYEATSSRLRETNLIPPASAHTPVKTRRPGRRRSLTWLLVALLALAVAAAGWWLWYRYVRPATPSGQPAPVVVPPPAAEPGPAVEPAAPPAGEPSGSAPDPNPAPAATTGSLKLEFSRPCWLEVYDARGDRLAHELAEPGAELSIGGQAPWRVLLGDASAAHISLGGEPVVLPDRLIRGRMASVSIGRDGRVGPAMMVAARN